MTQGRSRPCSQQRSPLYLDISFTFSIAEVAKSVPDSTQNDVWGKEDVERRKVSPGDSTEHVPLVCLVSVLFSPMQGNVAYMDVFGIHPMILGESQGSGERLITAQALSQFRRLERSAGISNNLIRA